MDNLEKIQESNFTTSQILDTLDQNKVNIIANNTITNSENNDFDELQDINGDKVEDEVEEIYEEQPQEESEEIEEIEKNEIQEASTTNCLALTIKEEHKLVAVKNVFLHSLKVTWKVMISTIALHILKIFF